MHRERRAGALADCPSLPQWLWKLSCRILACAPPERTVLVDGHAEMISAIDPAAVRSYPDRL